MDKIKSMINDRKKSLQEIRNIKQHIFGIDIELLHYLSEDVKQAIGLELVKPNFSMPRDMIQELKYRYQK